jgi:hypothetical protein
VPPGAAGREAWIGGQVGQAQSLTEARPLAFRADGHGQLPVGGRERLVGHDVGVGVTQAPGRLAADEGVLGLVDQDGQGRGQQRRVDALPRPAVARPRQHRRQDADDTVQAGHHVTDGHPDLGRMPAGGIAIAGDGHQAGRGLDDEVVARASSRWPGPAVAGDGQVDQLRSEGAERLVAEAQTVKRPRARVLHEDIGRPEQGPQDVGPLRRPQVQADRSLVAVDREVVGRGARAARRVADPGRPPAARGIAIGRLDLDDVGPKISQEHRGVRSGEDGGRVDHAQARQRARACRGMIGCGRCHVPHRVVARGARIRPPMTLPDC